MATADWLAHGDSIGDHMLRLKSPKMGADTPKPELDLIGNTHTDCPSVIIKSGAQITFLQHDLTATAQQ